MQNTCVSLDCPFIPYCKEYNFLIDRGDKCEVQQKIVARAEKLKKQEARNGQT